MTSIASPTHSSTSVLESNLAALALHSSHAARRIRDAAPAPLDWVETDAPECPSAIRDGRALASRRHPRAEAQRLADRADLHGAGVIALLGFGLGHHVRAVAERSERHTLVVVFEPDVSLLRAAMERIDMSGWLREHNVLLLTDERDRAGAIASLRGAEALFAIGVSFLEHPPSMGSLGSRAGEFARMLTSIVETMRTNVLTTMVHTGTTIRNELMNSGAYLLSSGIEDLDGAARGRAAIVVSAGPSLSRNLDQLADPIVRQRFVIVAVQTALRPMLERGIRPHFVTALDYHEISRRFYEGLTAADVEGVTLVAEPKANGAIIDSWPGAMRMVGSELLDRVLGKGLTGNRMSLEAGATVAHLAYYLARHLGADPVILVGQDLAFTDGQYYSRGAAIHEVWAPELNPFNTLETMEWQRIMRGRANHHTREDVLGRPVYTDDQMTSYLAQFERDFKRDQERGLRVLDATEGGVRKAHTSVTSLSQALDQHTSANGTSWTPPSVERGKSQPGRLRALRLRLQHLREDVRRVERLSRDAATLLEQMERAGDDETRLNRLIAEVHRLRDRVEKFDPAYWLAHRMNQTGSLKRFRADRELKLAAIDISPRETQRRQIERDRMNVQWLGDTADSLEKTLQAAIQVLPPTSAPKLTRDPGASPEIDSSHSAGEEHPCAALRIGAVVVVDLDQDPFGRPRDLTTSVGGAGILVRTLERLAACRRIDRAVLLTNDRERLESILPSQLGGLAVETAPLDVDRWRARQATIRGARLWARTCWRGGLGFATIWDEVFDPVIICQAMERAGLDAALIVGADWALVDAALCDEVVERVLERPGQRQITFCQAPPGLAGCAITLELCRQLAQARQSDDPLAWIGGVLGYRPTRPKADPIASSSCVQIEPAIRGALGRFVSDDPFACDALAGASSETLDAQAVAQRWHDSMASAPHAPSELIVEACARTVRGPRGAPRPDLDPGALASLIAAICEAGVSPLVTLGGSGDPLCHDAVLELIDAARSGGALGIHLRSELLSEPSLVERIGEAGLDVISVDLHADSHETYRALLGDSRISLAVENTQRLLASRTSRSGWMSPWIVPRILRRDAVYQEIEAFYDRAVHFAGAGVIDQCPTRIAGQRIEPLGKPASVAVRDARTRMMVLSDGSVIADERDIEAKGCIGNALREDPLEVWARLMDARAEAVRGPSKASGPFDPGWTGW